MIITEFVMADLVCHEESLFELRSNILMNDQLVFWHKRRAAIIELARPRICAFHIQAKLFRNSRRKGKGVVLMVEPAQGGTVEEITADTVLVAIGRRPYADGLGLDTLPDAPDTRVPPQDMPLSPALPKERSLPST